MNDDLQTIYKRLKKLLNMSEDTSSPQEAANAARMAESLMRKYQIEHSDIVITELKDSNYFTTFDLGGHVDQSKMNVTQVDKNLSYLSVQIAILNDAQVKVIVDTHFGYMLRFQGYKPDVEICKFMFRYIHKQMQLSAKRAVNFSRDFQTGFIRAVVEELKKAIADKKADQLRPSSGALVIVKSDALALHFGEVKYRKSNSVPVSSQNFFNQGYAEGKKMDVMRRGVTNKGEKQFAQIK